MPQISVVMPAYKEGDHIYNNISVTLSVLAEAGYDAEIVAVDDGSPDNTFAEIERAASDFKNVVPARNPYNMGKGMALRTGFDYSSGDIVVFLDADLDLHPSQIVTLVTVLENESYDIVVTSKHHPESKLDYPWSRKVASYTYYIFIKYVFGLPVRDTQTGLKAFRREVLDRVFHLLLVKKFAYDVELLATAVRFGYRVREIPVVLDFKRALKWGRIRFGDVVRIFVDTMAIFYRLRILHYYDIERPHAVKDHRRVLVVVRGCPPPDDVIRRLSLDSNTTLACIAPTDSSVKNDVLYFDGEHSLREWFSDQPPSFEIVGFLGSDCLPAGSWVKNALRNFADPDILAVCGPMIPGPFTTVAGRAAGLVSASFLTTGPEYYLHSYRRVCSVRMGSVHNAFVRVGCIGDALPGGKGLAIESGRVVIMPNDIRGIRYDPDVAVSRKIKPLFMPYLKSVASNAWKRGRFSLKKHAIAGDWWNWFPVALWWFFIFGWFAAPVTAIAGVALLYCLTIAAAAAMTFDILSMPLFFIGVLLEHAVRAVAFPMGVAAGLIKHEQSDRFSEQSE